MKEAAQLEATPSSTANAFKTQDSTTTMDPTFMQNQISIQRSPSAAHLQASALSRKLSVKSNGSSDHAIGYPPLTGIVLDNDGQELHGHERQDSDSSNIEISNTCSLSKASTEFGEIHVKRWDSYNECLSEEVSAAEVRIQKGCVPEILDKLQEYSVSNPTNSKSGSTSLDLSNVKLLYAKNSNIWTHLTSSMKGALLTKITGQQWNHWQVSSSDDYRQPREPNLPDDPMDFRNEEVLHFVFPRSTRTFSDEVLGRDRTEQAMDTTSHIKSIIATHCTFEDQDEIIGEMQFCYITGMMLGNLACMEQWGHIVKVLFRAFKLVLELPVFVRKVIESFHAQLIYDEEGLDSSILDHDPNLGDELKKLLTIFKSRLTELLLDQGNQLTDDQNAVGQAFEELESWLWKWGWDLRSNYVRSGKVQLEDGEMVDLELADFEDEDERGKTEKLFAKYLILT
ncbi:hypothetical protein OIDMADRAFT_134855 [Oidiodendron maius Zn]|uniref:AAR2 C-terminal domain-containing protein n=1 Tax=Oidiodendron maius (strain Zn) TaxID=913774 RepID=A0A0C3GFJ3_OIDMZ|nr:hypothetical protein OIDMADRAFT_134855 [Oidiodendron maius Zn]